MSDVSSIELILANLVLFLGALLQGVAGYGVGTLSAPLVFLINPLFLPGPLIANATILNLLMLLRNIVHMRFAEVRFATQGALLGIVLAGLVLLKLGAEEFKLVFGLLILFAVSLSVLGVRPVNTRRNNMIAGSVSGFMGTITGAGGPPVALLYQNESPARIRGNLSAFFLITSNISLLALVPVGLLGWLQLKLAFMLLPGLFIGFWLSKPLAKRIPVKAIRPVVLTIAAIAGLSAIFL